MEERKCAECGKDLKGRTDQRFCNDDCRNKFNRLKRQTEKTLGQLNQKEIIAIIKNNYDILRKRGVPEKGVTISDAWSIRSIGINPRFYTSMFGENGETWYCCFDFAWRENSSGHYEIMYVPEEAFLQVAKK